MKESGTKSKIKQYFRKVYGQSCKISRSFSSTGDDYWKIILQTFRCHFGQERLKDTHFY